MSDRPSRIWKELPFETRLAAADAFWRDESESMNPQHVEAVLAVAKRLNFRAKSVQALSIERRSTQLARLTNVSDAIATRALVAYHMALKRPLMAAFLDALGIPHDEGVITAEEVTAPDHSRLTHAVDAVRGAFPAEDVNLYLRTLAAVDEETWAGLQSQQV
jgi:hypothetical protein